MAYLDVHSQVVLTPVPHVELTVEDSALDNPAGPQHVGDVALPVNPSGDNLMQSSAMDPATGDLYVAQPVDNASEDLVIARYTYTGGVFTRQDFATLVGGGHGNSIEVENDGGDVYVWNWWRGTAPGPARWKYSGTSTGKTVTKTDSSVMTLPDMNAGIAMTYSIDQANDLVALWRGSGTANQEYVYLRSLSEFKAGVANLLGTFTTVVSPYDAFQGMQVCGDYVYVWRGGAYGQGAPNLVRYTWAAPNGAPLRVDLRMLGYGPGGEVVGGENEAEGITMRRDTDGAATLFLGVASGPKGARTNAVWSIRDGDVPAVALGVSAPGVQRTNADGTVERVRSDRVQGEDGRGVWSDYECPQQELVTYQSLSSVATGSPPVSEPVMMPDVGPWLIDPADPAGSVPVVVQKSGGFAGWKRPSTVATVPIAGSAVPYVVESSVRQAASGDLSLWVLDSDLHDRLVTVLGSPGPKLLSWPRRFWPGYGQVRWVAVGDFDDTPNGDQDPLWGAQLALSPCARPAVVDQDFGKTWAQLGDLTWADLDDVTWGDL